MNRIDTRDLALWPDPDTDPRLLPGYMCETENDEEVACYKLALNMAMERFLTDEQRLIVHMRFWLGMNMSAIGREVGVSTSAATKRVSVALGILRERVGFCVEVYNILRRSLKDDERYG